MKRLSDLPAHRERSTAAAAKRNEAVRRENGPPRSQAQGGQNTGMILVVDDDRAIRQIARAMLCFLGFRAACAVNGRKGLDYYRAHRDEIDLVLLDLMMPVMDGRACFRELRRIDPGVRVVLSTGNATSEAAREVLRALSVWPLPKPYSVDQLSDVLERALRA